ncbi:MAG: hypothetical protein ABI203_03550 [Mucilaginibacter sp.]
MTPKIELAKPRDFGEIISDTFTFTRQNFKPLLKYFFIFCGFFMLASASTSVLNQINAVRVMNSLASNNFETRSPFAALSVFTPTYFLAILFLLLEYIAIAVTVLCYLTLYKQKQNNIPKMEEMWGYFKFYFLKIFGSSLLVSLIVIVGCFFCLIPGIYLYPIMSLVIVIMVVENTNFSYAFNHSFALIKDNWWATFGVFVVMTIIIAVASMVVVLPAALLNVVNLFMHLTKGTSISITTAIVTTLLTEVGHIFHILTIVSTTLIYFNLTETKEGTGLIERINQFGTNTPDSNITPEEY